MRIRKLLLIIVIMFSMSFVLSYENVRADSGWDSSYDSGSSYSSGDSSDRSSNHDYSFSYRSNSSSSKSEPMVLTSKLIPLYGLFSSFMGFLAVGMIYLTIHFLKYKNLDIYMKHLSKPFSVYFILHIIYLIAEYVVSLFSTKYFEVMWYLDMGLPLVIMFLTFILFGIASLYICCKFIVLGTVAMFAEMLSKVEIMNDVKIPKELLLYVKCDSIDEFKKILFERFVDVQNAWMEFSYKDLKNLCASELYNTYHEELEALKLKSGKNIMKNFKINAHYINNISKKNNSYIIEYYLDVSFIDYVINTDTNKVTHGKKSIPLTNKYLLVFEISCSNDIIKCPQCDAELDDDNDVCKYCGANINRDSKHITLVSKRISGR